MAVEAGDTPLGRRWVARWSDFCLISILLHVFLVVCDELSLDLG